MTPSADEFEQWLANPVTEFVRAGCQRLADGQQSAWAGRAWAGDLDPIALERFRTRADAYLGLAQLTYEQALEANGAEAPQ